MIAQHARAPARGSVIMRKSGRKFGIFKEDIFIGIGSIIPQNDVYRCSAEIGYWLGELFWGNGYATQAVKLLTQFGFKDLN